MKALVVDDSPTMRQIARKLLLTYGFDRVVEANNGLHALDLLELDPPPDLVLLDWNMPVMNGADLLTALRERARLRSTRVLIVTADAFAVHAVARVAGADGCIPKPLTATNLRYHLARLRLLNLAAIA
jgi:two-component system chemotaxis response regulator CheY